MQLVDVRRAAAPLAAHPERIADPVSDRAPGAVEIGFALPERYNASSILFSNLDRGRANKAALLCGDRKLTYAQLCETACRAGNALASFGLGRGSRVLLLMSDTPEYVAAIFGAMRAGFVPILVNTLSPPELVAYYLQDSGAEAVIVQGGLLDLVSTGCGERCGNS
jgi:acyl-CoA synthetase (AMP-forming)/AMP-acid ligase II